MTKGRAKQMRRLHKIGLSYALIGRRYGLSRQRDREIIVNGR